MARLAQTGARAVTAEMRGRRVGPLTPEAQRDVATRRRRERELLQAWFRRHLDDMPVLDRPPTLRDVELWVGMMIEDWLRGQSGNRFG